MRKGGTGEEVFLSVCGLMACGTRTVLLSRWRTGGDSSLQLVREFVQELPFSSAADAWQRSVQLGMERDIDVDREPRVKPGDLEASIKADHPFFWSGYLLVDTGGRPADEMAAKPDAKKPAPADKPAEPPSKPADPDAKPAEPDAKMEKTGRQDGRNRGTWRQAGRVRGTGRKEGGNRHRHRESAEAVVTEQGGSPTVDSVASSRGLCSIASPTSKLVGVGLRSRGSWQSASPTSKLAGVGYRFAVAVATRSGSPSSKLVGVRSEEPMTTSKSVGIGSILA